jgi:paraquat-inducible protein B
MAETISTADPKPLPIATAHQAHRSRIPLVWLVPALAACIGAWLAVHAFFDHGPMIEITFLDAEGIEAGKTKLRYESVDIGDVKAIRLAPDGRTVEVTVETANFATPFLVSGTRFWIVRPRLGTTGISGLGTLLSGPYIAMDAGASKTPARHFAGLERPPVVSGAALGRRFALETKDLGSLSVSSPAYFHHIQVGRISAIALNPDGRGLTLDLFIDAPYDRFVTEDTRFWHASGVDVDLDSSGVHVQSQSLTTILAGGIAFEAPPGSITSVPSAEESRFSLALNRTAAMKPPNGITESYVLYFGESLRGLAPGAVVDFRGVEIGEVVATNVQYERANEKFQFPVLINIYPERLQSRLSQGGDRPATQSHPFIARLIEQGFRAQLRSASLLTGQLYVALDFFPHAAKVRSSPELTPMPLPTIPGNLEQVQNSIISVAHKLDELPLNKIARDLDTTLLTLNSFLGNADHIILPEAKSTLRQARGTLQETQQALAPESSLQSDLHSTLSSVGRAADSIRTLADFLDKHPEALIRGKTADPQ